MGLDDRTLNDYIRHLVKSGRAYWGSLTTGNYTAGITEKGKSDAKEELGQIEIASAKTLATVKSEKPTPSERKELAEMKRFSILSALGFVTLVGVIVGLLSIIHRTTFTDSPDVDKVMIWGLVFILAIGAILFVVYYALRLNRHFSFEAEFGKEKKRLRISVNRPDNATTKPKS